MSLLVQKILVLTQNIPKIQKMLCYEKSGTAPAVPALPGMPPLHSIV